MANNELTRPIPRADAERELIAVRHSESQRRLRYGMEPPPMEPNADIVFLSFKEVVGWIALERLTALEEDPPGTAEFFGRWKVKRLAGSVNVERRHSLLYDLRMAIARVRWWQRSKRRNRPPVRGQLRPLHWMKRRHVRWINRQRGDNAENVLFLLQAEVRKLRAAEAERDAAISAARQQVFGRIAAGEIVALGRPGTWRGRRFKRGALHEPIPSEFFANAHNTIRLDGWATCSDSLSGDEWMNWNGPEWGDVKFRQSAVLSLWPKKARLEAAVVATIRDKSRLTAWLKDQMQAKPNYPISKAEMKNQAKNAGMTVSERSFNGAWEQAVRDTGAAKWSMPGRKSKQRIDTPNNRDGVL